MIDQISVFVENTKGRLADVTEALGRGSIDLHAMSIADTAEFGILRLIVDKPQKALDILREAECIVSVTKVVAASFSDEPGSLGKILRIISDNGISIEYLYAFNTRKAGSSYAVFRFDDNERAEKLLAENGIIIKSAGEISDI